MNRRHLRWTGACWVLIGLLLLGLTCAQQEVALAATDAALLPNWSQPSEAVRHKILHQQSKLPMRKFPYPYQSMLSITSDIDETTPEEFAQVHRFLNTHEKTRYGQGLGLDIADSFFVYMGNDATHTVDAKKHHYDRVLSYFQGTDPQKKHNADLIAHYWKAGWIDSMHAYGDFSRKNRRDITFRRSLAEQAWPQLHRDGIDCEVWINHGNSANVENFGGYLKDKFSAYQEGDNPKSPFYHTDVTLPNGIRFVWNSHGGKDYGVDDPVHAVTLRDGQRVWAFNRYTQDLVHNKIEWRWSPNQLRNQLSREHLDQLVAKGQYAILAQHLGSQRDEQLIDKRGIQALKRLARYQQERKILVARTSRLLKYDNAKKFVHYAFVPGKDRDWLNIQSLDDPLFGAQPLLYDNLRGLTFYVPHPDKTVVLVNMEPLAEADVQVNPQDETGKRSIGIKWFEPDLKDYTKTAPKQD